MLRKKIADILAAHVDRRVGDSSDDQDDLLPSPADQAEVTSLLRLSQRLKETLAPVAPSLAFRQHLKGSLISAAVKRAEEEARDSHIPFLRRRWVLIGAAAGSALSVAGIVAAILLRHRSAVRL
ncbi:MAG: hypothetical protein H8E35_15940 [Ardenticatenia bacterium]|nr:hypothetical protein [Ardenticatenia bacterium]